MGQKGCRCRGPRRTSSVEVERAQLDRRDQASTLDRFSPRRRLPTSWTRRTLSTRPIERRLASHIARLTCGLLSEMRLQAPPVAPGSRRQGTCNALVKSRDTPDFVCCGSRRRGSGLVEDLEASVLLVYNPACCRVLADLSATIAVVRRVAIAFLSHPTLKCPRSLLPRVTQGSAVTCLINHRTFATP